MCNPCSIVPTTCRPSIVPPPFGSGYGNQLVAEGLGGNAFNRAAPFRERLSSADGQTTSSVSCLQSCRPLSGAVMAGRGGELPRLCQTFNRAAPFRERLCESGMYNPRDLEHLQSCRPFSGAVMQDGTLTAVTMTTFNRAAPFRERLSRVGGKMLSAADYLQSCRPLSGAVMHQIHPHHKITRCHLQSCRPLSGAVISHPGRRKCGW